ncbi:MAG: hypothetical protein IPF44_11345 [Betaproteobacteria bacterium]|nr:hypothetical protein [Betaproteobacteria bacterium]
MTDTGTLNFCWSRNHACRFCRSRFKQCESFPGSRSTPLALAMLCASHGCVVILRSERAKCGVFSGWHRQASRRPILLLTPSGTPANWLPAVIEASQSGIPVILLSADRPLGAGLWRQSDRRPDRAFRSRPCQSRAWHAA